MKRKMWKSNSATRVLLLALLVVAGTTANSQTQQKKGAAADTKIRMKMTSGSSDRGMETVTYIKGARMRSEMANAGMEMTSIKQCDLKRTIMINNKTRTYLIINDGERPAPGGDTEGDGGGVPATSAKPQPTQPRRGGVVNITDTMTDTRERKERFGFTARHIKTSTVKEASPEACDKNHKSETDGWYIDFQYEFDCPGQKPIHPWSPPVKVQRDCEDEIRTKSIGTAKLGFPVMMTITGYQPDGSAYTMTQEVIELSRAPLDAALFEVPESYALAKSMQELYGVGSATAAGSGGQTNSGTVAASPYPTSTSAAGLKAAGAPKKAGTVRIGIVTPKAQLTTGDAADAAEAVRNTFASYLTGPTIEVVSLTARLPSQALEEARQSQCDYVLYTSLTQKKGGGGGLFGKALGNIANSSIGYIPGGNTRGEAAARAGTIAGVRTAARVSGSIKAKDELSLEYKLEATDGARPGVANTAKGKAKSDGEDVLTPLIEKAAEAVVGVATKK